jgi:hypothetical protein
MGSIDLEVTGASQHGGARREKMVNNEAWLFQYYSRNGSNKTTGEKMCWEAALRFFTDKEVSGTALVLTRQAHNGFCLVVLAGPEPFSISDLFTIYRTSRALV